MNKKNGVTLIELIIAMSVALLLMWPVYSFMNKSFSFGNIETQNLDAIQEMTFILNTLRYDLRALCENPDDHETFIKFDESSKTLNFAMICGISENGFQILSKVKYHLKNNCLIKTYSYFEKNGEIKYADKALSKPKSIKHFNIKILNIEGNVINNRKSDGNPAIINTVISHSSNQRLKMNTYVYLTYMKDLEENLDYFRLVGYKTKMINSPLMIVKTNVGNILINLNSLENNENFFFFRSGINIGTPSYIQKPIIKQLSPFGGIRPGEPNPYSPPPPPAASSGLQDNSEWEVPTQGTQ